MYNDGKLAQAIDVYRQAVATDPDNPSLYISMAKAQIYTSQYEAALESAERALILNNNNPIAHAIKAWALDFQGDYTQAEAAVKRALELDANNAFAHAIYAEIMLTSAAALMKSNPATKAVVEGHTDSVGDPVYNKLISENRAAAVKNFLIGQGIAPSRLSMAGFGSKKPLESNNTPEGAARTAAWPSV